jgi:tRNA threonylcarbamoyl adenosine modification protein YeaZ
MKGPPALAVTGSNLTGDAPFSCALRLPHGIVGAASPAGGRVDLARLVADLCAAHSVRPDELGELLVDVGPGSYTGLRVAITFVRTLQQFAGVRVFALESMALLAARARDAEGPLHVLLDARRERVHAQTYASAGGALVAATPARALPPGEALAGIAARQVVVVPANLPAAMLAAVRARGAEVRVASRVLAEELFAPGLPLVPATAAALEPRYLMGSYAEE